MPPGEEDPTGGVRDVTGEIDVIEEGERDLVERARAGDFRAAKAILHNLVQTVRAKESGKGEGTPHPLILEYFADCFDALLAGTPAEEALHVKRPTNRPDEDLVQRNVGYAFEVYRLRNAGMTRETAIEQTARDVNKSTSTVRKAYDKYSVVAELLTRMEGRDEVRRQQRKREPDEAMQRIEEETEKPEGGN